MVATATRRVEHVMGTAVSFDIRSSIADEALTEAVALLHWVDRTFSVFRPDSQISRIGRGGLAADDAEPEVREVLVACEALRAATEGWFQHEPAVRLDRPLDPSGYVKGWAIQRAADVLRFSGATDFCVSGGGDVVTSGHPAAGRPWQVGVRHPLDREEIAAVIEVRDAAVATSGAYERHEHIWSNRSSEASLLSVTVVGPDLGLADGLATAIFSAGTIDVPWLPKFPDHEVLVIDRELRLLWRRRIDVAVGRP